MVFTPAEFDKSSFNCPNCNAFSMQRWKTLHFHGDQGSVTLSDWKMAVCQHCFSKSFWKDEKMIFPETGSVISPNTDLPSDVIDDYNEAKSIINKSPRGSAALLRLAIQKLCKYLGEPGDNINNDIKNLVAKGLPPKIQQSLDIVRVVGNNAVHPGQIDLTDNRELAIAMFGLINVIAEVMISQPKHIESLYSGLPENLLKGIENRDKN